MPITVDTILQNEALTFPLTNVATTGEELPNRTQAAYCRGLQIGLRRGKVIFKGSLHKYFEDGTNYRYFGINEIRRTVNRWERLFEFDSEKALINFIEVGFNIPVDVDPTEIIKSLIMYRHHHFVPMPISGKGYGRVCKLQNFDIKIYNKSLQNGLDNHLLRIELKVKKMKFFKPFGIEQIALADLTFGNRLLSICCPVWTVWNEVVLRNPNLLPKGEKEAKLYYGISDANHWLDMDGRKKNRELIKFRDKFSWSSVHSEMLDKIQLLSLALTKEIHQESKSKISEIAPLPF